MVDDKQRHDDPSAGAATVGGLRHRSGQEGDGDAVEPVHEVVEERADEIAREAAAGPSVTDTGQEGFHREG